MSRAVERSICGGGAPGERRRSRERALGALGADLRSACVLGGGWGYRGARVWVRLGQAGNNFTRSRWALSVWWAGLRLKIPRFGSYSAFSGSSGTVT